MNYQPTVALVKNQFKSDKATLVEEVKLSNSGLEIIVASKEWKIQVKFDSNWGFRVLDEMDLSEFWAECNLTVGWCFEVVEGGWNSLEKTRDSFVSGKLYETKEFLIVGLNECVSVLALEPPEITELMPSNKVINKDIKS